MYKMNFTDEKHKRYVLNPIQHANLWALFKQQQSVMWTTEEIDFSQDHSDWKKMDKATKHFILNIIAFFAGSDMLIVDNLMDNFMSEVTVAECKCFYTLQAFIETIHSETYSQMLQEFSKLEVFETLKQNLDPTEQKKHNQFIDNLMNGIKAIPSIKGKADWATKYMDQTKPFDERLWAFAIFEGVLFSASFCSIYWLRKKNLCHGLTYSNELIARDEGLHAKFGVEMFNMLGASKPSQERVHQILDDAVQLEMRFVDEALPERLEGINADTMKQYVKYCANHLLSMIQYDVLYKDVTNPYDWMNMISIDSKSNFFEKRVAEYTLASVGNTQEDMEFTEDAAF